MRVALDATPLTILKSGIGEYTFQLALHLAKHHPEDEFLLVSNFPFPPVAGTPNLKSLVCRGGWIAGRWWLAGLPQALQREKVSVFHGTDYAVPLLPCLPSVLSIHDLSSIRLPQLHERRTRRTAGRLPWMVRVATHIVTDSTVVRDEVIEEFKLVPSKVSGIPIAPRPQFSPIANGEERSVLAKYDLHQPFVLFVGTLEPRKNLLSLVRAFAGLPDSLRDESELVLCGRWGWKNEPLQGEIARLGLEKKVRIVGYVSDAELPPLYRAASVFAYPSLYEGFGLPPVEAMASGVPVIASTDATLKEVLGEAALLVNPSDVGALSAALAKLLDTESLRMAYQAKGLSHVQKFSWDSTADRTYAVYLKALAEYESRRWVRFCTKAMDSIG
jgi:glycosyltransferase involved in cell wall biosynthesis